MTSAYQDVSRFGEDGLPRVDMGGRLISGPRVIAERVAARVLRAKGSAWWAPDSGAGVGALLNHDWTPGELRQRQTVIAREVAAEDGVVRSLVTVTGTDAGVEIRIQLLTSEGAVELNVGPSAAVSILAPGGI